MSQYSYRRPDNNILELRSKEKISINDKYYNCHKFGLFKQDCPLPNKRLNKIQYLQKDSRSKNSKSKNRLQMSNS